MSAGARAASAIAARAAAACKLMQLCSGSRPTGVSAAPVMNVLCGMPQPDVRQLEISRVGWMAHVRQQRRADLLEHAPHELAVAGFCNRVDSRGPVRWTDCDTPGPRLAAHSNASTSVSFAVRFGKWRVGASRQRFPRIKGKQLPDRQPRAHAAPPAPASTRSSRSPCVFRWAPCNSSRTRSSDTGPISRVTSSPKIDGRAAARYPGVRSPGYAGSPFGMGGTDGTGVGARRGPAKGSNRKVELPVHS